MTSEWKDLGAGSTDSNGEVADSAPIHLPSTATSTSGKSDRTDPMLLTELAPVVISPT